MDSLIFTDVTTLGYGKYAGTYKVATEIRKHGYTCQVVDNFTYYSMDQLKKIIDKFCTTETLMVGFSVTFLEKSIEDNKQVSIFARRSMYLFGRPLEEFNELTSYIKKKFPNIKICVGGAKISANFSNTNVNYAVVEKADVSIKALLDHLKLGSEIKGYKNVNGVFIIDGKDYPYPQIDFSNDSIVYEHNDIIMPNEALPVEIARGCIFSCAFCSFPLIGKHVGDWTRTAESLRSEFIRNYEQFGTTHYMFTDELINESLEKLEMLKSVTSSLPFKLTYTSYARIDLIWRYPQMRELLLETGAIGLNFGIETLNETAGKLIGKGLSREKIIDTLNYCAELWKGKIIISSNFIVGLPKESERSIRETVKYLVSDECPLDIFGFTPLAINTEKPDQTRSSKMDKDPGKYGYSMTEKIIKDSTFLDWDNGEMTYETAVRITRALWRDPKVQRKSKFPAALWVGRILNLGYSVEEFIKLCRENTNRDITFKEMEKRASSLRTEYFNRLMAL